MRGAEVEIVIQVLEYDRELFVCKYLSDRHEKVGWVLLEKPIEHFNAKGQFCGHWTFCLEALQNYFVLF